MKLITNGKGQTLLQGAAVVAVAALFGSEVAMAGADATFNTALTAFTGVGVGAGTGVPIVTAAVTATI